MDMDDQEENRLGDMGLAPAIVDSLREYAEIRKQMALVEDGCDPTRASVRSKQAADLSCYYAG